MRAAGLADKVLAYCRKHDLIRSGSRVLLAVSGGPDSVALLHIAHALRDDFPMECAVLHLEHGLRGEESLADQEFVEGLAGDLGMPFFTKRANVRELRSKGESLEEAARRARLEYYREVLASSGFDSVATGHTADDNVETIVFRLLTGTGPAGFSGILPRCGPLVHPLLCASRAEVLRFLGERGLRYRSDASNLDPSFARNRIRHTVLPLLGSINPRVRDHVLHLAALVHEDDAFLSSSAATALEGAIVERSPVSVKLDCGRLAEMELPVRRRVLIEAARSLSDGGDPSGRSGLGFREVETLLRIGPGGNRLIFSNSRIAARVEYGRLVLEKRVVGGSGFGYLYSVEDVREPLVIEEIGKKVIFEIRGPVPEFEPDRIYLDFEKLTLPIEIRTRREGDRIRLRNLGVKKLKKILIDDKVPLDIRAKVPVIASGPTPVAIFRSYYGAKNRVSEEYMVSGSTRRVLVCALE